MSYYDYYQPEAYIPQTDTYIEKDSSINEDIERLRIAASSALISRQDVIVIASVSCIYGLGSPEDFKEMMLPLEVGMQLERDQLLENLVTILYNRNDVDFKRGCFRVRGEVVDIYPAYMERFGFNLGMNWSVYPVWIRPVSCVPTVVHLYPPLSM